MLLSETVAYVYLLAINLYMCETYLCGEALAVIVLYSKQSLSHIMSSTFIFGCHSLQKAIYHSRLLRV